MQNSQKKTPVISLVLKSTGISPLPTQALAPVNLTNRYGISNQVKFK